MLIKKYDKAKIICSMRGAPGEPPTYQKYDISNVLKTTFTALKCA